jgi:hypothetical protein
MTAFVIRLCCLADIITLATFIRAPERWELEGLGRVLSSRNHKHALVALYRRTAEPMAAFIDGELAACWGDEAQALDPNGRMWMGTTAALSHAPLTFFRQARGEVARLLERRERLICDVDVSYTAAVRFWRLIGASFDEPWDAGNGYRFMRLTIERPRERMAA